MKNLIYLIVLILTNNLFSQEKIDIKNFKNHYNKRKFISFYLKGDTKFLIEIFKNNLYKSYVFKTKNIATLKAHTAYIRTAVFSNDCKYFLTGGDDNILRLWDNDNKKQIGKWKMNLWSIQSAVFSPDGKYIAVGSLDTKLKLLNLKGKELRNFNGHLFPIHNVKFSPDGQKILSSSTDKSIKLWDLAEGREIFSFEGHKEAVWKVDFHPNGTNFVSASLDGCIKIWDLESKKEISNFFAHKDGVRAIAFSPDGKKIASGGDDNLIKIWDFEMKKQIKIFKGHKDKIWSVKFSPDGKYLASGSLDKTIKLWDLKTNKEVFNFKSHKDRIRSLNFSKDGKNLISGADDNLIKIWDVSSWVEEQEINKNPAITNLKFRKKSNNIDPVSQLAKGNLYLIIFADTKNKNLNKNANIVVDNLLEIFKNIAKNTGFSLNSHVCTDNYFNKKELEKIINNINNKPEDMIVFYYFGGGIREKNQKSKYAKLKFNFKKKNSCELKYIDNLLNTKKMRLSVVISETSNIEKKSIMPIDNINSQRKKISIIDKKKYLELFAISSGSVIISSCEKEQISWISNSGSYFLDSFLEALEYQLSCRNPKKANWENLLIDIKSRVVNFSGTRNKVQIPEYDNNTY